MTFHEIVAKVQESLTKISATSIERHIAIQVNVTGEGEGAFYIEVSEGKINVQPFDYFDRDATIIADSQTVIDFASGKLDVEKALAEGKVSVEGDASVAVMLKDVIASQATKKTTKSAAKTTTKSTAKTTTKKACSTKKETSKKEPAKKTTKKTK